MELLLNIENFQLELESQVLLNQINLNIYRGQRITIKGPSGCGKSSLARFIIQALPKSSQLKYTGKCYYHYNNIIDDLAETKNRKNLLGNKIGFVWQEPKRAFNPLFKCTSQIIETILQHRKINHTEARKELLEIMDELDLKPNHHFWNAYPHQLSGGELQRFMLALALCNKAELIIADEPTTGLDTVNAKMVLDRLISYCEMRNLALLFISHDAKVLNYVGNSHYQIIDQQLVKKDFQEYKLPNHNQIASLSSQNEIAISVKAFQHQYDSKTVLDVADFEIKKGQSLGITGVSGSGKSTLARYLCGLLPSEKIKRKGNVQLVFQSAGTALDPMQAIGPGIEEVLKVHNPSLSNQKIRMRAEEMLHKAGMNLSLFGKFPSQLSGGEKQRIGIIRALATQPQVLIGDEFLASVDADMQHKVLNWIMEERENLGFSFIFISHQLDLLRHTVEQIWIMQKGQIIEQSSTIDFFTKPQHPHSKFLLANIL